MSEEEKTEKEMKAKADLAARIYPDPKASKEATPAPDAAPAAQEATPANQEATPAVAPAPTNQAAAATNNDKSISSTSDGILLGVAIFLFMIIAFGAYRCFYYITAGWKVPSGSTNWNGVGVVFWLFALFPLSIIEISIGLIKNKKTAFRFLMAATAIIYALLWFLAFSGIRF